MIVLFVTFFFSAALATWSFGSYRNDFKDIPHAMKSQFSMLLGNLPSGYTNDFLLGLYVISTNILQFFLMLNFLLAIVVEAHTKVREDIANIEVENEIFTDLAWAVYREFQKFRYGWPHRMQLQAILETRMVHRNVNAEHLRLAGVPIKHARQIIEAYMQHTALRSRDVPQSVYDEAIHKIKTQKVQRASPIDSRGVPVEAERMKTGDGLNGAAHSTIPAAAKQDLDDLREAMDKKMNKLLKANETLTRMVGEQQRLIAQLAVKQESAAPAIGKGPTGASYDSDRLTIQGDEREVSRLTRPQESRGTPFASFYFPSPPQSSARNQARLSEEFGARSPGYSHAHPLPLANDHVIVSQRPPTVVDRAHQERALQNGDAYEPGGPWSINPRPVEHGAREVPTPPDVETRMMGISVPVRTDQERANAQFLQVMPQQFPQSVAAPGPRIDQISGNFFA